MERKYWNIVACLLPFNIFISELGGYGFRTSIPLLIGFVILVPSCFLGNKIRIEKKSVLKISPLLVIGILNLIFGIIYKIPTYIAYGFIFSFQLPCILLKFNKDSLRNFARRFAGWVVIFGGIGLFLAICLVPIEDKQYCGLTENPNQWGEWQVIIITSALHLVFSSIPKSRKMAVTIVLALSVSNVIFCKSRTTLLAMLAVVFAYALYSTFNFKILAKQFLCICLTCVLVFPIAFYSLQNIPNVTCKLLSNLVSNQITDNVGNKDNNSLSSLIDSVWDRYSKGINDGASFSSGRFEIWKVYASELSFKGHKPDQLIAYPDEDNSAKEDAHNTFLQIGYQNGLIGMLALIIIVVVLGIFYLMKFLYREITLDEVYYASLYLIAVVYMMLSSSFGPYNSFTLIGFWIFSLGGYATLMNNRYMIENIGD